ncbi:hypothetical protein CKAH01_10713 [Colletotrichum kahawae]|uniref:Uncharacterized protein n=1 Tax=Colletotrichum kahawae TaxID=34407 RepID=A0AAD9XWH5_COLKA|nr:hypothetical protein CKAH01_10713 [Colletotrichum kahawae]
MVQKRSRDDYKVAWICPLEVEQIVAMEMPDEEHPTLPKSSADHNVYSLGSINGHNVVIAGLHQPGNCPAATVVTDADDISQPQIWTFSWHRRHASGSVLMWFSA